MNRADPSPKNEVHIATPSEAQLSNQRSWQMAVLGLLLFWTFLLGCTPMGSFDIWWHLKTGQLILGGRGIPQVDWYLFTDWGRPWIDLHWGFQVLVALLYSLGGVNLLIVTKALCLVASIAIGWSATGSRCPGWVKACCWILPVIGVTDRGIVRPEMVSLLLLAVALWVVLRAEQRPRSIWVMPALMLIWVNCHALFILGLIVGAAYVVDRVVRGFAGGRFGLEAPVAVPRPATLLMTGVLTLFACLCNPYLEQGALFPLELYRKFTVEQGFYAIRVGEFHQPIDVIRDTIREHGVRFFFTHRLFLLGELILFVVTAASFLWLWLGRPGRLSVLRLILFVAFSYLFWEAYRNRGLFSLVAGVVLCSNCADWLMLRNDRREASRSAASNQPVSAVPATGRRPRGWLITACVLAGLILMRFTDTWDRTSGAGQRFGFGKRAGWYADEAARFAGQRGFPKHAFIANFGQAGVYIFHNGPEHRVFIDGRLEVVTRTTYERSEQILTEMEMGNPIWQERLKDDQGQFPVVILDSRFVRPQIRGMLITPGWRLVFADAAAAVFLDERTADRLRLRPVDPSPLTQPPGTRLLKTVD